MGVSAYGLPKSYPNQYAANPASSGATALDFGFDAGLVKLMVDVGSIYVQLDGNAATTVSFKLTSGEQHDFYDLGVPMRGLAYTSTSTAASFRIGAFG